MSQQDVIIGCQSCGTKNRVPRARLKENPKCGKCGETIEPESVIIKCSNCGSKNRVLKALIVDNPNCGKCHEPLKTMPVYDYWKASFDIPGEEKRNWDIGPFPIAHYRLPEIESGDVFFVFICQFFSFYINVFMRYFYRLTKLNWYDYHSDQYIRDA